MIHILKGGIVFIQNSWVRGRRFIRIREIILWMKKYEIKKLIKLFSFFTVVLFFVSIARSCMLTPYLPIENEDSIYGKVVSNDEICNGGNFFSINPPKSPPKYPHNGLCGSWKSINQYAHATSFSYIHTYCSIDNGLITGCMLYAALYVTEQRQERTKAYLLIPSLEYQKDGKWISTPFPGFIIWENSYYDHTYIGKGGIGKIYQVDTFIPFRLCLKIFNESERRIEGNKIYITFLLNQTVYSSTGIWFYDVPPYS